MWYIACVLCLLFGAVAVWYFMVRPLELKLEDALLKVPTPVPGVNSKYTELVGLLESVYSLSFGSYGAHPQALVDAFNKVWKAIGKAEQGVPK